MAKAITSKTGQVIYLKKGDPGQKGDRGPSLRGPMDWEKMATGFQFQCGAAGEDFLDVVIYGGKYYQCIVSHKKTASNYPGSNYNYWRVSSNLSFVATDLLLATYALIKNLGVESVEMKDAEGNVIFRAKDGNVTCKSGTFTNIDVQSGKIGAFDIQSGSLHNTDGQGNVTISNNGRIAAMGGGTLSAVLGYDAAGGFRNDVTKSIAGSINMALYLSAYGAAQNFAFNGRGNGVLNGMVEGYALQYVTPTASSVKVLDIADGKYISVYAINGTGLMLPGLSSVRDALNNTNGTFAVLLHIFAKHTSPGTTTLYGRTTAISGADSSNYPYLYDQNGNNVTWQMAKGDSLQVMLVYDGYEYYAQIVNQQNR